MALIFPMKSVWLYIETMFLNKLNFIELQTEHYEELKEDLENILNLGIKIGGITCDGTNLY